MNKKLAVVLTSLIVLASTLLLTSALPLIIIDITASHNEIAYNEVAQFVLEVTNNQDILEKIYIPTPRSEWGITITPYILTLEPHSSQKVNIYIAPPVDVKEGKYSIYFEFKALNNSEASTYRYLNIQITKEKPRIIEHVEVIPVENISIIEKEITSFLTTTHKIIITNTGNIDVARKWKAYANELESYFFKASPKPKITDLAEGKEYTWSYSLKPGESTTITYTISLVPLLVAVILLAIAIVLLLFFYFSRFKIIKEIIVHRRKPSGDEHRTVKIRLNLKNNSYDRQTNVVVEDHVPVPLNVTKDFGTIAPTVIKKQKDKTILIWKFDVLEPREERVLSYAMSSSLEVIGKVLLPPAVVKQKAGKKIIKIYSKIIKIEV